MFERLPVFVALQSLTLWIRPDGNGDHFIAALKVAPNVTTLTFRLVLYNEEGHSDREVFEDILQHHFPLHATESESMKTFLTRKFPRCKRIGFHFCMLRNSRIHFRRGLRRRMERQLRDRLEDDGTAITQLLHFEWLDEDDYQPVVYNKTNGKPPWKALPPVFMELEADSEYSDSTHEASDGDDSERDRDGEDE
ncbi:hypothetical protein C8R45DRAFT_1031151 [Mycena sanguinolenta]|nr:hypothetical protein C8R45DRAFT_1031151 [Mycena sanguinolenta]